MTDPDAVDALFEFVSYAARLRQVTRNNLGTPDRYESVAEHSWHLGLMCLVLFDRIQDAEPARLDLLKMLKMAILHDIVEIDCGDPFRILPAANWTLENNALTAGGALANADALGGPWSSRYI